MARGHFDQVTWKYHIYIVLSTEYSIWNEFKQPREFWEKDAKIHIRQIKGQRSAWPLVLI